MSVTLCSRCVLTEKDHPEIQLNSKGVCDICQIYDLKVERLNAKGLPSEQALEKLVAQLKQAGKNQAYDCIIGVSGGVDSSYVAWLTSELGLRALAVHMDNGWNSELAILNIESMLSKLNIDLYTYVVDWQEFRDLQRAYIRASVVDIEVLTDHAIAATLQHAVKKFKVPQIISGEHLRTEGVLPPTWVHNKMDHVNIKGIHAKFGERKLHTYPFINYYHYRIQQQTAPLSRVPLLDYVPYNKVEVKKNLRDNLGWRDYGGKHHESIFTRFYQTYILPKKFGIDKRKSHLSTLISAGQMTREEALEELKTPAAAPDVIEEDKRYVVKKLGFSQDEFDFFMQQAPIPHLAYPSVLHQMRRTKSLLMPWK